MTPFSIFQPAPAGLRERPPPRAGTVQPVKSLPLKSGFHGSADSSDVSSTKQRSVTMQKEMPFIGILPFWDSEDVERGTRGHGDLLMAIHDVRDRAAGDGSPELNS